MTWWVLNSKNDSSVTHSLHNSTFNFPNGENENERGKETIELANIWYIIEKFGNKFNWDAWNLGNSICWIAIF